jgi:hypothetical protein
MEPQEESIKMQTSKINDQVVGIIEHDSAAIANKIVAHSNIIIRKKRPN